ncbi:hypothetical protein ACGFX4_28525 [Kitasatospora sp. NPDC048365]|uniref:hypothetical protein n=1 Tax=Kitasatospora sp. NPDC048365 TaxID=3364050 RepID=UPI003711C21B
MTATVRTALHTRPGRVAFAALGAFAVLMAAMSVAATRFHDTYGSGILNLLGARNAAEPRTGGYSADTAYAWLTAFGADGRRDHLLILLLDLPLIAAFTLFTAATLRWATPRARSGLRWTLLAVPLAAAAANLLEDAGLTVLLSAFPVHLDGLAAAVSAVNGLKSGLYSASLLLAVAAAAVRGLALATGRCQSPGPATG